MNGTIKYLKRKNLGNYEHEEAAAEIFFGNEESADAAQAEAMYRVHDMLGLGGDNGVAAAAAMAKAEALTNAPEAAPLPNPSPIATITVPGGAEKPVADTHGGVVSAGQIPVGIGAIAAMAKTRRKAARAIDIGGTVEAETPVTIEADADWTSEAPVITNADLGRACSQKLEALGGEAAGGRGKINSLLGKFIGPGKKVAELPPEMRTQFLAELAQLS